MQTSAGAWPTKQPPSALHRQWLSLSTSAARISNDDLLAEFFPVPGFANPWTNVWLQPLIGHEELDKRSRFVIQLMQERYQELPSRLFDKPTPYCVYNIFQRLLKDKLKGQLETSQGRAHRADCVLQCCELFYNQHHDKDLPHPTANNYRAVLSLYAKETNTTRAIPLRCLEILSRMQQRYNEFSEEAMRPTAQLYVNVFVCWAKCQDENNWMEAAQLLQALQPQGLINVHSYEQVLLACATSKEGSSSMARVIWTDLNQNHAITSKAYAAYMACLRQCENGEELLLQTFGRCCTSGHIDRLVLEEMYQTSPTLWNKVVQRVTGGKWTGDLPQALPHVVITKVPEIWKRNTKTSGIAEGTPL